MGVRVSCKSDAWSEGVLSCGYPMSWYALTLGVELKAESYTLPPPLGCRPTGIGAHNNSKRRTRLLEVGIVYAVSSTQGRLCSNFVWCSGPVLFLNVEALCVRIPFVLATTTSTDTG